MPNFFESSLPKTKTNIVYPNILCNIVIKPGTNASKWISYISDPTDSYSGIKNRLAAIAQPATRDELTLKALPKATKEIKNRKRERDDVNLLTQLEVIVKAYQLPPLPAIEDTPTSTCVEVSSETD